MYNYIQMGISKQPPKPFPIKEGLPCQLKWTQSTVYLTDWKILVRVVIEY